MTRQQLIEPIPRVAAPLAAAIEPFEQQLAGQTIELPEAFAVLMNPIEVPMSP
jgi:hypothetical protein